MSTGVVVMVNIHSSLRESRWLQYTESVGESRAIERFKGWHVIIAASGMCDAGRVRHHLRRLLWREEATVLIVGFQAIGTLGRLLQEGRQRVRIQGDEIKVHARVRSLDHEGGLRVRLDALREILRTPKTDTAVTAPFVTWATWL